MLHFNNVALRWLFMRLCCQCRCNQENNPRGQHRQTKDFLRPLNSDQGAGKSDDVSFRALLILIVLYSKVKCCNILISMKSYEHKSHVKTIMALKINFICQTVKDGSLSPCPPAKKTEQTTLYFIIVITDKMYRNV